MQTKFSSMKKSENTFSWGNHFSWCSQKTFPPYKIKTKEGWKFLHPVWNFPYNYYKISALPRVKISGQGWNLPCNEPLFFFVASCLHKIFRTKWCYYVWIMTDNGLWGSFLARKEWKLKEVSDFTLKLWGFCFF